MKKAAIVPFLVVSFLPFCGHKNSSHAGHDQTASPAASITYADSVNSGLISVDTVKKSTPRVAMGNIGECHVHVTYYSPGVRGREIWGGLVPYNEVWAAGAHRATTVSFSNDVMIADKSVPAGKYGFFILPTDSSWTLILNSNHDQHLADEYDAAADILRFPVVPEILEKSVQRLTYAIEAATESDEHGHHAADRADAAHQASGALVFSWENKRVKLLIQSSN